MSTKMRRNFSGAFLPRDRGKGAWQLTRAAPQAQVFVRNAETGAADAFGTAPILDLGIEWHGERVLLTFMSGGRVSTVAAADALVHEPLGHLYDSLPWRASTPMPGGFGAECSVWCAFPAAATC